MPTWKCVIPGYDLISPNKLIRMPWYRQAKEKEQAMNMVFVHGRPLPVFDCPVRMVIARMFGKGQRPLDTDNLYGGCKLLIDSLKAPKGRSKRGLSVIIEDNPKALDLTVVQFKNAEISCDVGIWACPMTEVLDLPKHVAMILQSSQDGRASIPS